MTPAPQTVQQALWLPLRHPVTCVLQRWNWKAAATSAAIRGMLFFVVNLRGGLTAATAALATELGLRLLTSGFYGTITQTFSRVEPRWAAILAASVVLPLLSHSIELLVHWLRGTPQLAVSITASVLFTVVSTAFNLHVMRCGILIVGPGSQSLWSDLRAMPALVLDFIGLRPRRRVPLVATRG